MVGIISVVIGGHFGGGDHFDGGDHFGGGGPRVQVPLSQLYLFWVVPSSKPQLLVSENN